MKILTVFTAACLSTLSLYGGPYSNQQPYGQPYASPAPYRQPYQGPAQMDQSYQAAPVPVPGPDAQRGRMNPSVPVQASPNLAANSDVSSVCQRFAQVLQGDYMMTNGVCLVMKPRSTGMVTIGAKPTQSPLVSTAMFSFEGLDQNGMALNLGETGLLQEEVEPFLNALLSQGMIVTALHNHWLNTNPPVIMYMHWYYLGHPLDFAQKVANAWSVLKK